VKVNPEQLNNDGVNAGRDRPGQIGTVKGADDWGENQTFVNVKWDGVDGVVYAPNELVLISRGDE
jgi:hypothetical protein